MKTASASQLAGVIDDRSARGIAAGVNRMVSAGTLVPGVRLPTVRSLAADLGVSPTTVSEAWQSLSAVGAIETRGRQGTFVVGRPRHLTPERFRRMGDAHGQFALDLSTGTPDPALLPDLGPALAHVSRQNLTTSYLDEPVLPALEEVLIERWPFVPEALTVVDGAMDALDRLATDQIRFGDRVLVENPAFAPLIDLLEQLGAEVIALDLDDEGVTPESLAAGLTHDPVALFLQPRAHNPAGVSLTRPRARKLASLLGPRTCLIVEDDHAGDISSSPLVSFGEFLPARTVHIRSFSKSHGPDLRLAAVGGAGEPIEQAVGRRMLGPGWSSRLLQAVLLELLTDETAIAAVATARGTYRDRRRRFAAALAARGVTMSGTDGINAWVEVVDEQAALVALAARGIGAAPGSPFLVAPLPTDHLRLTISQMHDGLEATADAIAIAATAGRRPFRR